MPLLDDALTWLHDLTDQDPDTALSGLDALRSRHPGTAMRLVWQREAATGDYHYDLLLPGPSGTVSLSYAPDRAIPWPLRGSQRSGEQVVLRVNGADMTIERAVSVLDTLWEDASLARRLVDHALVEQALAAWPAGNLDLQAAMDAFRRARGLLTAEATRRWMTERGIGHARLEELVAAEAAVADLRREVVAPRLDDHLAAHLPDYDLVRVLRLRYADPSLAEAAVACLRDASPEAAAAYATRQVLAGAATCRMEANPRIALQGVRLPVVVHVLAVEPADPDDPHTRALAERRLFDDWLAEQRGDADLQWFWGSRPQTDRLTADLLRNP
ncbi:TIGR04500 family putative peptide maturation system protein [Herbidospora sp. RD11066]